MGLTTSLQASMLLSESPFEGSNPSLTANHSVKIPDDFFLTLIFISLIFFKNYYMSRIDELKKQYPELNISLFDMMSRLDVSKTYKYLPLFCKIFGDRFNVKTQYKSDDFSRVRLEIEANLINRGISTNNLTDNQLYGFHSIMDFYNNDTFYTMKEFMELMEKGVIENKDVTSYGKLDDIRAAITLANMKEFTKELEGQIINEYEDEKWIVVRPLTFAASAKYGASTRWCTTYKKEKQYFERYWRNGILVYFINKQTGYKFAGYKGLHGDKDFSFWNAEDSRTDYLSIEVDDYLFPLVKRIFNSDMTNKNLSSDEIQEQVHIECVEHYEKMYVTTSEPMDEMAMEQPERPRYAIEHAEAEVPMDVRMDNLEMDVEESTNRLRELINELAEQNTTVQEIGVLTATRAINGGGRILRMDANPYQEDGPREIGA